MFGPAVYIINLLYICKVIITTKKMKWSELRKKAEAAGWRLHRNGAKHDIYMHPDKDYLIQIERHGSQEVKTGLFNKLKKQIGF